MRKIRLRRGAEVQAGDRVLVGGTWYSVRTAVSSRNKLRHLTATNESTSRNAQVRLDPVQDFEVERDEPIPG